LAGLIAEEVGGNSKNVITLNKAVTPWELNRKNGKIKRTSKQVMTLFQC
jgi:hypothetical protein